MCISIFFQFVSPFPQGVGLLKTDFVLPFKSALLPLSLHAGEVNISNFKFAFYGSLQSLHQVSKSLKSVLKLGDVLQPNQMNECWVDAL